MIASLSMHPMCHSVCSTILNLTRLDCPQSPQCPTVHVCACVHPACALHLNLNPFTNSFQSKCNSICFSPQLPTFLCLDKLSSAYSSSRSAAAKFLRKKAKRKRSESWACIHALTQTVSSWVWELNWTEQNTESWCWTWELELRQSECSFML